uniref:Uncharacterized protein n=1 Tax=Solibacter usitatus (strain Ellin6076) TaxID=234267 RepID=Q01RL7_SOLUE
MASKNVTATVGKVLANALSPNEAAMQANPKATPKDTNLGPNAAFPCGIKIIDAKGNISWERFKTADDRDKRNLTVKGKRVDFTTETAIPAAKTTPISAKPAAPAKPAAKPADKPKGNPNAFAIHVNKTGRVCFGKDAAERMGDSPFCKLWIEGKLVRLGPTKKEVEGAVLVRDASGRPYISATKQFKPLGFDGSRAYDCEAKPYGNAGFEFRLS